MWFLIAVALAEQPLPSYTDELVVHTWLQVNADIERACIQQGATSACDTEILEDAIAEAERFQQHVVRDARLIYLTGLARKQQGRAQAAETAFRAAVELDPKRQDAWHDLGELLLADGRYADARDAFAKVSELVVDGQHAWLGPYRQAEASAFLGEPEAFETHLREALRRGFTLRMVQGLPAWQGFYQDPRMRDSVVKLLTVYAEPEVLRSLEAPR